MNTNPNPNPNPNLNMVHLAIDVQRKYIGPIYSPQKRMLFPGQIRQFADTLRVYDIPTIWVVAGNDDPRTRDLDRDEYKLYANKKIFPAAIDIYGLDLVEPRDDEAIFVKLGNDCFAFPRLQEYLDQQGVQTCIITGMNTYYCVRASILGAINANFHPIAIFDKLAHAPRKADSDPQWHKRALKWGLRKHTNLSHVSFQTSAEFLDGLKQGGITPQRNAEFLSGRSSQQLTA
jgi:nicotinamidase-related amidase